MAKTLELAFALAGKLMPSFTNATRDAAGQLGEVGKQAKAVSAATQKRLDAAAIKNLGKAAAKTGKSFGNLAAEIAGTALAVTGMVTAAGGALYGIATGSAGIADTARKNAQAVGLTTEAFTELAFAAKQSGVEEAQFIASTNKLNEVMKNALGGNQAAIDALKRGGVADLFDGAGNIKSAEQVYAELADTFASMPDGLGKSNLAMDIFGKSLGGKLIPMLNSGSAGLDALRGDAIRFGKSISDADARSAEAFNDSFANIKEAISGVSLTIGRELWPALTDIHNAIADWIGQNNELLRQKLPEWINDIKNALPEMKKQFGAVWESIKAGALAIDGIAQSMGGWIPFLTKMVGLWVAYRGLRIGVALGQTVVSVAQLGAAFVQAIPAMSRWIALKGAKAAGAFHSFAAGAGRAVELLKNLAWSFGKGVVAVAKFAIAMSVKAVSATASFAASAGKTVVAGLASFGKAVWAATLAAGKFSAVLLANPIGIVIAAVAALTAAAIYLYYNWDDVAAWLAETWEWMKGVAADAFHAVEATVESVWRTVKDIFASGWALLPGWMQDYLAGMYKNVVAGGQAIFKGFYWVWDKISNWFAAKTTAIKEAFDQGVIQGIVAIVKNFNLIALFSDLLGGVSDFVKDFDIATAARSLIGGFGGSVIDALGEVKDRIVAWFTTKTTAVKEAFDQGILQGIAAIVKEFNIITLFSDLLGGVSNFVRDFNIADAAKALIGKFADAILAGWAAVKDTVAAAIVDFIPGGETIVNVASAGADYAKAGAAAVGSAAGSALDWGKSLFGYADGGIVGKPQLAMVGEAGPEVIVPVTRPGRAHSLLGAAAGMMGLGKGESAGGDLGITITFSPTINITGGDAEAVGARVKSSLDRSLSDLRRMLEDIMRDNRRVALR